MDSPQKGQFMRNINMPLSHHVTLLDGQPRVLHLTADLHSNFPNSTHSNKFKIVSKKHLKSNTKCRDIITVVTAESNEYRWCIVEICNVLENHSSVLVMLYQEEIKVFIPNTERSQKLPAQSIFILTFSAIRSCRAVFIEMFSNVTYSFQNFHVVTQIRPQRVIVRAIAVHIDI